MPKRKLSTLAAVALVITACAADEPPVEAVEDGVAFTIPVADLIPEGIAYDPAEGVFYVGSTFHRTVWMVDARDPDALTSEFVSAYDGELWGVVGMRVDPERRLLWLASSHAGDGMPMRDMDPTQDGMTGLFAFDLATGELRHRAVLDHDGFLNDVTIAADGTVYVTDSGGRLVYRFTPETGLEPFAELGHLGGANGIDLTPDEAFMFVAVGRGIARVDMASGAVHEVVRDSAVANVIDGLYAIDGGLVVVQPYAEGRYVSRIDLDSTRSEIVADTPILEGHDLLDQPTTAAVVGRDVYVILNSHLQTFRRRWAEDAAAAGEGLSEPAVLRVPVDR